MKINVTARDIQMGWKNGFIGKGIEGCPVALALRRRGFKDAKVGMTTAANDAGPHILLPLAVVDKIGKIFSSSKSKPRVRPFSFILTEEQVKTLRETRR